MIEDGEIIKNEEKTAEMNLEEGQSFHFKNGFSSTSSSIFKEEIGTKQNPKTNLKTDNRRKRSTRTVEKTVGFTTSTIDTGHDADDDDSICEALEWKHIRKAHQNMAPLGSEDAVPKRFSRSGKLHKAQSKKFRTYTPKIRPKSSLMPMSAGVRLRRHVFQNMQHFARVTGKEDNVVRTPDEQRVKSVLPMIRGKVADATQYNLKKNEGRDRKPNLLLLHAPYGQGMNNWDWCNLLKFESMVNRGIQWSFRASNLFLFLATIITYYVFTFFFAVLIFMTAEFHPNCIGGSAHDQINNNFMDAFALSWTTFSTVGYGIIYPEIYHAGGCGWIIFICTFESFFGILFASIFSAIMIAKLFRAQCHAQVIFSDVMVVRYGNGVMVEQTNGVDFASSSEESHSHSVINQEILCPIIEFRIINRLSAKHNGEIIDAAVNMVACVDKRQIDNHVRNGSHGRKKKSKKGRKIAQRNQSRSSRFMDNDDSEESLGDSLNKALNREKNFFLTKSQINELKGNDPKCRDRSIHTMISKKDKKAFRLDRSGKIELNREFVKLAVESPDHPLFERDWVIRHTLDDTSPLVLPSVRKQIRSNKGFWPTALNNYEAVRNSIGFDQILINFSGTSNADCNSVYSNHVYYSVNMNVGYRFVNLLYKNPVDDSLRIDHHLMNDVTPQAGGGAEPIDKREIEQGELMVL